MDQLFESVYTSLYDGVVLAYDQRFQEQMRSLRVPYYLPQTNLALMVRDEIERGIGRVLTERKMRSDGRYFLLINFTEMIAIPLMANSDRVDLLELRSDIRADIETIIQDAAGRTGDGDISGGDILQSVATKYPDLRVARFKLWN